jgi:cytochrome P450
VKPALTPEEQQESLKHLGEMVAYMIKLVAERRQNPGTDLLSGLIHAEEQGDRLNESELFSMLSLLIVAGHETTVTFIGNAVLALLQQPLELDILKQHPEKMAGAVEELLRYDSPVERALTRFVARDTELGGKQLKQGDVLIVILAAANRDEGRFDSPETFLMDRQPNPHVAFGKGIHYCLGAPLARLEGEIALNTLFRRLPGLQLDIRPEELVWREVPLFHSLVCLPVKW